MNAITSLGRDDTAPSGFRQFLHCTRITARLLRRIAESIVMAAFIPIWSLVDCLSWMSTTQININGWPAFIRLCFLCLVCAVLASDLPPFKRLFVVKLLSTKGTRRSSCSLVSTDHPPSIKSNKWVAGGPVGRGKNKPMGRRPAGSALRARHPPGSERPFFLLLARWPNRAVSPPSSWWQQLQQTSHLPVDLAPLKLCI